MAAGKGPGEPRCTRGKKCVEREELFRRMPLCEGSGEGSNPSEYTPSKVHCGKWRLIEIETYTGTQPVVCWSDAQLMSEMPERGMVA